MDEIKKLQSKLGELLFASNWLGTYVDVMPAGFFTMDILDIRDSCKFAMGYLECMLHFGLELEKVR